MGRPVEEIQTHFFNLRNEAMDALMDLIHDIKQAKDSGATMRNSAPVAIFSAGHRSTSIS